MERRQRSERIWTSTSADASESVLPVAGSARFRRRERVQDYGPRANRSRAKGAWAEEVQPVSRKTLGFAEKLV
jgi:hypothetical protein